MNKDYPVEIQSKCKKEASKEFRLKIIDYYLKWFNGEINTLYGEKPPSKSEKLYLGTPVENAIMTWGKLHQQQKYQHVLRLPKDVFKGMKILDLGSGPYPSSVIFENCEIFCLDPLIDFFKSIGYPFHHYESRVKFIKGYAEKMPFKDHSFDAIISVNAIDHLDNLSYASEEINRVLRKDGMIIFHIHYHKKTILEPIELNDDTIKKAFSWCENFECILHENENYKNGINNGNFALWSNYPNVHENK